MAVDLYFSASIFLEQQFCNRNKNGTPFAHYFISECVTLEWWTPFLWGPAWSMWETRASFLLGRVWSSVCADRKTT